MQIVIEIAKNYYQDLMALELHENEYLSYEMTAIRNGTPLPKGHGRLVDVNELLDDIGLDDNDYNRDVNAGEIITFENIDRITTIIEADKEDEE